MRHDANLSCSFSVVVRLEAVEVEVAAAAAVVEEEAVEEEG